MYIHMYIHILIDICHLTCLPDSDSGVVPGPTMALPRAASPLTTSPVTPSPPGATPIPSASQTPPPGDDNEPVNVTITVKATGSQ